MSLHNFLLFHLRRHVKNSGFVLHHGFRTPRNRCLRPRAFICFSVFRTRDEALALVFDILHHLSSLFKDHFVTYCDNFRTDFCNSVFTSSEVFNSLNFAFIQLPSAIEGSKKARNGYHTAHKVHLFFLHADLLSHKNAIALILMENALERSFFKPFKTLPVVYYQV